jgi:pilus assembly protein CpaB
VRGYEDRIKGNQELVQVFVAKDIIARGTTGDVAIERGLIDQKSVPREVKADDAITSLAQIKGNVADVTVLKGEQIIAGRFVPPGRVSADVLTVPPNRVAMSMEVPAPPGVAQFVQIGDHVSLLAQFTLPGRGGQTRLTKVLLHDIEVLQVGKLVRGTPGQSSQSGQGTTQSVQVPDGTVLLTLALTMPQAEKLANAIFNGRLYVTLLPKTNKPSPVTPGRTDANPFA